MTCPFEAATSSSSGLQPLLEGAAELGAGEHARPGRAPPRGRRAAAAGTSLWAIRRARPSAIAVLPTPASPIRAALFLRRRLRASTHLLDLGLTPDHRVDPARRAPRRSGRGRTGQAPGWPSAGRPRGARAPPVPPHRRRSRSGKPAGPKPAKGRPPNGPLPNESPPPRWAAIARCAQRSHSAPGRCSPPATNITSTAAGRSPQTSHRRPFWLFIFCSCTFFSLCRIVDLSRRD